MPPAAALPQRPQAFAPRASAMPSPNMERSVNGFVRPVCRIQPAREESAMTFALPAKIAPACLNGGAR